MTGDDVFAEAVSDRWLVLQLATGELLAEEAEAL